MKLNKKMLIFSKNERNFKVKAVRLSSDQTKIQALNLMIQDVTGNELDIPAVQTQEEIIVGVKATVDGAPANGDYVLADGTTLNFVDGVLNKKITPPTENEMVNAGTSKTLAGISSSMTTMSRNFKRNSFKKLLQ